MLVGIAIVGLFASTNTDLSGEVIDVLGLSRSDTAAEALATALRTAERSRTAASVVGFVGSLWSAVVLVGALEHAFDSVWQVTGRGPQGQGLRPRLGRRWRRRAVRLLLRRDRGAQLLPAIFTPLNLVVALALNVGLFWWTAWVLCNRDVGWRPLLPGAILRAVGLGC